MKIGELTSAGYNWKLVDILQDEEKVEKFKKLLSFMLERFGKEEKVPKRITFKKEVKLQKWLEKEEYVEENGSKYEFTEKALDIFAVLASENNLEKNRRNTLFKNR